MSHKFMCMYLKQLFPIHEQARELYMWLFFQNVLHVLCTDELQFNVYHRVLKKAISTKIVYSYM